MAYVGKSRIGVKPIVEENKNVSPKSRIAAPLPTNSPNVATAGYTGKSRIPKKIEPIKPIVAEPQKSAASFLLPAMAETAVSGIKKAGNFIREATTGASETFGRTLGTAASALDETTRQYRNQALDSTNAQVDSYLRLAQKETDKKKKENILNAAKKLADTSGIDVFNNPEYQKTAKQVFGEAGSVALDVLTMGSLPKAGMTTFLPSKGIPTVISPLLKASKEPVTQGIKTLGKASVTQGLPIGAGYGLTGAMQEDLGAKDTLKSVAAGGAVGLGLQAGLGLVGKGFSRIAGKKVSEIKNIFKKTAELPVDEAGVKIYGEVIPEAGKTTIVLDKDIDPVLKKQVNEVAEAQIKSGDIKPITEDVILEHEIKKTLPVEKPVIKPQEAQGKVLPEKTVKLPTKEKTIVKEPLEVEAKKYKTSDEFVKSQGEPLLHGTPYEFDEFKKGKTTFFTPDKDFAESYGSMKSQDLQLDANIAIRERFGNVNLFDANNKSQLDALVKKLPNKIETTGTWGGDTLSKEEFVRRLQGSQTIKQNPEYKLKKTGETFFDNYTGRDYKVVGNDGKNLIVENLSDRNTVNKLKNNLPEGLFERYISNPEEITSKYPSYAKTIKEIIDFKPKEIKLPLNDYIEKGEVYWGTFEGSDEFHNILKQLGYDGWKMAEKGKPTYGIFNPENLKTKSQLIDIWKKAQKDPVETIKKDIAKKESLSRLESRVYDRLKAESPDLLEGDVNYKKASFKKQIKEDTKVIKEDQSKAYRIAVGLEKPKEGRTSASMNILLAEKARQDGNKDLYANLTRRRALEQTKRGQEIVSEKMSISDNSIDRYVKEAIKTKLDRLKTKELKQLLKDNPKATVSDIIDKEVKKAKEVISKKDFSLKEAQSFIDSLACK